jgi:hypothetical protein
MTRAQASKPKPAAAAAPVRVPDISMFQSPSALRRSEDAPCPQVETEPVMTGGLLEDVLEAACVRVDQALSAHSRMEVQAKKV